jgi:hypothetical protein
MRDDATKMHLRRVRFSGPVIYFDECRQNLVIENPLLHQSPLINPHAHANLL